LNHFAFFVEAHVSKFWIDYLRSVPRARRMPQR
jgi:hypothetical protein